MDSWPVQEAKARFSEFLDACLSKGPQIVTRRGTEAAVLVPVEQWRRLQLAARPSLKQLLLSDFARTDQLVPPPKAKPRRKARRLLKNSSCSWLAARLSWQGQKREDANRQQ